MLQPLQLFRCPAVHTVQLVSVPSPALGPVHNSVPPTPAQTLQGAPVEVAYKSSPKAWKRGRVWKCGCPALAAALLAYLGRGVILNTNPSCGWLTGWPQFVSPVPIARGLWRLVHAANPRLWADSSVFVRCELRDARVCRLRTLIYGSVNDSALGALAWLPASYAAAQAHWWLGPWQAPAFPCDAAVPSHTAIPLATEAH